MIQPYKVKIGNIFKDGRGYLSKVEFITNSVYDIPLIRLECGSISPDIYPVELTEDWLLSYGFKKEDSTISIYFHKGLNPVTGDYLLTLVWQKNIEDYKLEGYPFYKNGYHRIQYVHQLQNLYFGLVGEELILLNSKK